MSEGSTNNIEDEVGLNNTYAGKYLTFNLAKESFGIEILKVIEIIGVNSITSVPRTLSFVKGIINLRGKIIPIVDLRAKFGFEEIEYNSKTCTIICNVKLGEQEAQLGIIVDTVLEVVEYSEAEINPAPDHGSSISDKFVLGLGRASSDKSRIDILIDIDKLFGTSEQEALSKM